MCAIAAGGVAPPRCTKCQCYSACRKNNASSNYCNSDAGKAERNNIADKASNGCGKRQTVPSLCNAIAIRCTDTHAVKFAAIYIGHFLLGDRHIMAGKL